MFYNFKNKIYKFYPLFSLFEKNKGVEQREDHHPEGDVFNHSVQMLYNAIKWTNDLDIIFAAMLHDIGKQIDSKGHEQYAIDMLKGLISEKTEWLILNHIRFWYFMLGDMKKYKKANELYNHKWFKDLVLLCRLDKMSRKTNYNYKKYDRIKIIEHLLTLM